jgi:hypothetical protein
VTFSSQYTCVIDGTLVALMWVPSPRTTATKLSPIDLERQPFGAAGQSPLGEGLRLTRQEAGGPGCQIALVEDLWHHHFDRDPAVLAALGVVLSPKDVGRAHSTTPI